jgi:hypothetical protein
VGEFAFPKRQRLTGTAFADSVGSYNGFPPVGAHTVANPLFPIVSG